MNHLDAACRPLSCGLHAAARGGASCGASQHWFAVFVALRDARRVACGARDCVRTLSPLVLTLQATFPVPVNDCLAAYRWLVEAQAVAPERIVIAGDSAGDVPAISNMSRTRS